MPKSNFRGINDRKVLFCSVVVLFLEYRLQRDCSAVRMSSWFKYFTAKLKMEKKPKPANCLTEIVHPHHLKSKKYSILLCC